MFHILRALVCLFVLSEIVCAQAGSLPPSWKEKTFPIPVVPAERAFTKMANGYIWTFPHMLLKEEQGVNAVRLHSLSDDSESQVSLWLDGANAIWLEDVTVAEDQKLLFVGSELVVEAARRGMRPGLEEKRHKCAQPETGRFGCWGKM
jgi:hypothetical protein